MPAPGVVETYEPGVQLRRNQPRRLRMSRVMFATILCGIIVQIAFIVHDGQADIPAWMVVIGYLFMCCSFAINARPFVIDARAPTCPRGCGPSHGVRWRPCGQATASRITSG